MKAGEIVATIAGVGLVLAFTATMFYDIGHGSGRRAEQHDTQQRTHETCLQLSLLEERLPQACLEAFK